MKCLVFGGAGYIGSHTVKALRNQGHDVYIADDFSSGSRENPMVTECISKVFECNITSLQKVTEVFDKVMPDAVFLFAAKKSVAHSMSVDYIDEYTSVNLQGSLNVIKMAHMKGVKYFVFSSSAATFGEADGSVNEKSNTNPINYYGENKLIIEKVLKWYSSITPMSSICLRYFNASGYDTEHEITTLEQNPENLIPIVMEVLEGKREKLNIYGNDYPTRDGTCIRDYIHVDDLADAHVLALNTMCGRTSFHKSLCLGTGEGTTVSEVVSITKEVTGKDVPFEFVGRRAGDPAQLTADANEARVLLGWRPRFNMKDIISSTWYAYTHQKEN